MPIVLSHFEVTQLPDPNVIESLIDGLSLATGVKYLIAQESLMTFERTAAFLGKPVATAFTYKTYGDTDSLEGNAALGSLVWTGVSANPASANVQQTILNDDIVNLLTVLPLNDVTNFIEIVSMTGVKNLKVRGFNIYIGQRITLIDLFYAEFTAETEGGGDPYFELTYLVGKDATTEITNYTLTLDIVSLALLNISDGPNVSNYTEDIEDPADVFTNYPIIEEETLLEVSLGYAYATANVSIVINSPFLALNAYNLVYVDLNGTQTEEAVNTTINAGLVLDKYGKAEIKIKNYIVVTNADPKLGDVTITLLDIDGNAALVDGAQVEQIITSL